ncbi:hypothetical protein BS47DRAFT_1325354 [Hydnum rufescens UP504]|uniref:Uncharacterized protein n=1 Tax=Hydnum rufescens UP504 TaxID=1448309 RepID=A0A9P6B667_9AGAM|nr:hypothetical protein BS47DRAFT_1325354 [Hydnum rufescens UP504]
MFSTPSRTGSKRPTAQRTATPRVGTPSHLNPAVLVRSPPQTPPFRPATHGPSPARSYATDQGSDFMEMDENHGREDLRSVLNADTYAQWPELSVFLFSTLPLEVQQALKSNDLERNDYLGVVDEDISYALVVSEHTTFVWNCSVRGGGSSTCYIFPNPEPSSSTSKIPSTPPMASLVPRGASREPGLVLCSAAGEIRFWNNIATGLTGGEHFQAANISLSTSEVIVQLCRCEPSIFIAGTSLGRLFRLNVSSSAGRPHVVVVPFVKARNMLSRVASTIFSSVPISGNDTSIVSIAVGANTGIQDGREVWSLSQRRAQKWRVSADAWDQLQLDEDLHTVLSGEISRKLFNYETFGSELALELIDLGVPQPDHIVILLSFINRTSKVDAMPAARSFAVTRLSASDGVFRVLSLDILPYKGTNQSTLHRPRIFLIDGGAVAAVKFKEAFTVISLAEGATFQATLSLKDPWDRVLAIGRRINHPPLTELIMMTASRGLLTCRLDLPKIQRSSLDTPTQHLRSTMEQAVFFGSITENPFLFQLDPSTDGNLGAAAEQLSQDILASRSDLLRPAIDLRVHLADRRARLTHLIKFIIENGMIGQLSQITRQRLRLDSEKLFVAENLWSFHNRRLADGYPDASRSLLVQAISNYMLSIGGDAGEDLVRLFFRTQIGNIEVIFEELQKVAENITASFDLGAGGIAVVSESTRILLNMWESGSRHRHAEAALYGVDDTKLLVSLWTGEPRQIKVAQFFLEATVRALKEEVASEKNASSTVHEATNALRFQLKELATMVLAMWQERHDYLASNASDPESVTALTHFREHFKTVRPEILRALVRWGGVDTAYTLAEDYWDFRFLTELCNDPVHGDPSRISTYLERHRERFALPLYQWYLENGQLRNLLEPQARFVPLLEAFLRTNDYPRIQWIHDLAVSRYDAAATSLEGESRTETKLATKHVILSISKLCTLAQHVDMDSEPVLSAIQGVDHELDSISVHERLMAEFRAALMDTGDSGSSADAMSEAVSFACGSSLLRDQPGLVTVFRRLTRRLFQGLVLNNEDLSEILSLKDHSSQNDDFVEALRIVAFSKELSEGRLLTSLRSIWRRLYIADDWSIYHDTANMNDEQLDQSLRNTLLYTSLHAMLHNDDVPPTMFLSPRQVLEPPTTAELVTRYPGLTGVQISEIEGAYAWENQQMQTLLREHNLESWHEKVVAIEQRDRQVSS